MRTMNWTARLIYRRIYKIPFSGAESERRKIQDIVEWLINRDHESMSIENLAREYALDLILKKENYGRKSDIE